MHHLFILILFSWGGEGGGGLQGSWKRVNFLKLLFEGGGSKERGWGVNAFEIKLRVINIDLEPR